MAYSSLFLVLLMVSLQVAIASVEGRCHLVDHGKTIPGGDYQRELNVGSARECAQICEMSACCLAFEWSGEPTYTCTLKSHSLNGSIVEYPHGSDTRFGLCPDQEDGFGSSLITDHVFVGPIARRYESVVKETCGELCTSADINRTTTKLRRRRSNIVVHQLSLYSWFPATSLDPKSFTIVDGNELGSCVCISVLHGLEVSFGGVAGLSL